LQQLYERFNAVDDESTQTAERPRPSAKALRRVAVGEA